MPLSPQEVREQRGRAIRARREAKRMSMSELASEVGVQKETIYRIEQGRSGGSNDTVVRIANALGVKVGDLYRSEELDEVS